MSGDIVTTTTAPVTTVQTTTTTQRPNKKLIAGDANCDGAVAVSDAVYILQSIAYPLSEEGRLCADVTGNGDGVDAQDALFIQMAMAELVTLPEIEAPVDISDILFYAKDASFLNGETETYNLGYKGESYVNLNNSTDSSIPWNIDVPTAGNYLCIFNIANGTDSDRKMKVEVNGGSDYWVQPFTGTGAWTDWAERSIVLPLIAGMNAIKLPSRTEDFCGKIFRF